MINQWHLFTTGFGLLYKYVCSLQTMNSTKRHFQHSLYRKQIHMIILFLNYFWSEFESNLVRSHQDSKFPLLFQKINILRIDIDPNSRQKDSRNLLYMLRQQHSAWPGSSMFSSSFSLSQHTLNITKYKCCRSTEERVLYKCRTTLWFLSERIDNL